MDEVNESRANYILNNFRCFKAQSEDMKWYTKLVTKVEFDENKEDIDSLPNVELFKGEYRFLESLNNNAVSLEFIGETVSKNFINIEPHVLYVYSD